jgi:hypothetical protein
LKGESDVDAAANAIAGDILRELGKKNPGIDTLKKFQELFSRDLLDKPLILILDEFDALKENVISGIAGIFRNIYNRRKAEIKKPLPERRYLLQSVALIGVRTVLGIENETGSPFNVQRSLHVRNLTYEEVENMFQWYEKESGHKIEQEVLRRLYDETRGQPGLIGWFGELLSEGFEGFQPDKKRPITMEDFDKVYAAATYDLPNTNILNIISKARKKPYKDLVLELFRTDRKLAFSFDAERTNFLYMHGVVDREIVDTAERYIRFASPFVQKRLFNYFSNELFGTIGQLVEPFTSLEDVIDENRLNIPKLIGLYQAYLDKNKSWLFKDAPRRSDLKIYEAVYHFNLYLYISEFLRSRRGSVFPEFPTGNGKIDLLIEYKNKTYGLEVKSYSDAPGYHQALQKAAQYGKKLKLKEIYLLFFVSSIDEKNRRIFEKEYFDKELMVNVIPIFIETGN